MDDRMDINNIDIPENTNKTSSDNIDNKISIPETQKPFKSTFKSWIRTAALVVLITFIPDQISWAINYSPNVLWRDKAAHYVNPDASKDEIIAAQIAGNIEHLLQQIAYKENPQINLKLTDKAASDSELDTKSILINSSNIKVFFLVRNKMPQCVRKKSTATTSRINNFFPLLWR